MNRCPISYQLCQDRLYSIEGLRRLSKKLTNLNVLNYSAVEQRQQSAIRASKMSIQGVQPKLSAVLNVVNQSFEIVDIKGTYILKPQNDMYPELPENENITMRLAEIYGLEVPLHGLLYCKDQTKTYFVKRFDRQGKKKFALEDFAQLTNNNRETKYNYSVEKLVVVVEKYCTFPVIEKMKLFQLILFNFMIGNEDMHLKNYSLITSDNIIKLSPVYDLINTTIALRKAKEESALTVKGKKSNISKKNLFDYLAKDHFHLSEKFTIQEIDRLVAVRSKWEEEISKCFLSIQMKENYIRLLDERFSRIIKL